MPGTDIIAPAVVFPAPEPSTPLPPAPPPGSADASASISPVADAPQTSGDSENPSVIYSARNGVSPEQFRARTDAAGLAGTTPVGISDRSETTDPLPDARLLTRLDVSAARPEAVTPEVARIQSILTESERSGEPLTTAQQDEILALTLRAGGLSPQSIQLNPNERLTVGVVLTTAPADPTRPEDGPAIGVRSIDVGIETVEDPTPDDGKPGTAGTDPTLRAGVLGDLRTGQYTFRLSREARDGAVGTSVTTDPEGVSSAGLTFRAGTTTNNVSGGISRDLRLDSTRYSAGFTATETVPLPDAQGRVTRERENSVRADAAFTTSPNSSATEFGIEGSTRLNEIDPQGERRELSSTTVGVTGSRLEDATGTTSGASIRYSQSETSGSRRTSVTGSLSYTNSPTQERIEGGVEYSVRDEQTDDALTLGASVYHSEGRGGAPDDTGARISVEHSW